MRKLGYILVVAGAFTISSNALGQTELKKENISEKEIARQQSVMKEKKKSAVKPTQNFQSIDLDSKSNISSKGKEKKKMQPKSIPYKKEKNMVNRPKATASKSKKRAFK